MKPIEIIYLMHCFCIREPYHNESEAIKETRIRFLNEDLIIEDFDNMKSREVLYVTTQRGDALAELLMTTPLPERVWVDPRTKEIVG